MNLGSWAVTAAGTCNVTQFINIGSAYSLLNCFPEFSELLVCCVQGCERFTFAFSFSFLLSSGNWLNVQPSLAPRQQYWLTNTLWIMPHCAPVPGFTVNVFTACAHEWCWSPVCDSQASRTGLGSGQHPWLGDCRFYLDFLLPSGWQDIILIIGLCGLSTRHWGSNN